MPTTSEIRTMLYEYASTHGENASHQFATQAVNILDDLWLRADEIKSGHDPMPSDYTEVDRLIKAAKAQYPGSQDIHMERIVVAMVRSWGQLGAYCRARPPRT